MFIIIIVLFLNLLIATPAIATNATTAIVSAIAITPEKYSERTIQIQEKNFSYSFNTENNIDNKCIATDDYDYEGCWKLNSRTAKGFASAFSILIVSLLLIGNVFDR